MTEEKGRLMSIKVWLSLYEFMRFTYDWERFIQPITGLRLEYKGAMLDEYDCPVSIRMRDLDIFEMIPE